MTRLAGWLSAGILLSGCSTEMNVERFEVLDGEYWMVTPPGLDPATDPVLVHLHASGWGEWGARRSDWQLDLMTAGLVGVFPEGWGSRSADWNVGNNRHNIERDDTLFLEDVANDIRRRSPDAELWLGGGSKGGAMTFEMACLGEPVFDGFVPMSGAIEKPLPHDCTHPPRPIRHLQGTQDTKWPLYTRRDPESSHMGIMDSLEELTTTDECLEQEPRIDGDCQIWDCLEPVMYCTYNGGHGVPGNWIHLQAEGIRMLKEEPASGHRE